MIYGLYSIPTFGVFSLMSVFDIVYIFIISVVLFLKCEPYRIALDVTHSRCCIMM